MRERGGRRVRVAVAVLLLSAGAPTAIAAAPAGAAVVSSAPVAVPRTAEQQSGGSSLESAAAKAGNTGRAVAMSLIGLAFAVAGTVLAFRRDFKEAATVFAVGIIAVLLATPAGVGLLRDTVTSLFGSH
jgi:lipoprotein-anchoring transpeptidase ErfK/SrfK